MQEKLIHKSYLHLLIQCTNNWVLDRSKLNRATQKKGACQQHILRHNDEYEKYFIRNHEYHARKSNSQIILQKQDSFALVPHHYMHSNSTMAMIIVLRFTLKIVQHYTNLLIAYTKVWRGFFSKEIAKFQFHCNPCQLNQPYVLLI